MLGQLHRLVHAQRLGQRARLARGANALHRIGGDQPFAPQPGVEAAPARQDQRDAAATAATGVHARHPGPHVVRLHRRQRHTGLHGQLGQLVQVQPVQRERARGQALLHAGVRQIALDQRGVGVGRGLG
ncbi:hypothetical protein MASR1M50_14740 [Burkholderiales bacterium]